MFIILYYVFACMTIRIYQISKDLNNDLYTWNGNNVVCGLSIWNVRVKQVKYVAEVRVLSIWWDTQCFLKISLRTAYLSRLRYEYSDIEAYTPICNKFNHNNS